MTAPRGLTEEEAALWEKVAATVTPMHPARKPNRGPAKAITSAPNAGSKPVAPLSPPPRRGGDGGGGSKPLVSYTPTRPPPQGGGGLDSHWDRKLKTGLVEPDFALDLHGHNLDSAYDRLDSGLFQAKAMGARLVLVVTGKSRPVEAADRGDRRGAIRAKVLDWLAAGPHGSDIAAIRKAHRKHGGDGALYLVLRRRGR